MNSNLTRRLLEAIEEALLQRLTGGAVMDVEDIPTSDYRAALHWAQAQLAKRERQP